MKYTLLALIPLVFLAGCEEDKRREALYNQPRVEEVGEFDGCTVKYVNRGYHIASFYLARCGSTTTQTTNYTERVGKHDENRTSTTITQEITRLEAEKKAALTREAALEKLTPEERKALLGK